ncbi:hypothetical protein ACSDR0_00005 [Streptosporangium sp. G11]|uniref:hypothetical protein n=1 Tax=Streptosporangium sp. G11 TaxID=3436926 RepID=UPI003EBF806A
MKKLFTGVVALTAVIGASATFALPASAASAARPGCGSSYAFLKSYPIKGLDSGATGGYVSVYY